MTGKVNDTRNTEIRAQRTTASTTMMDNIRGLKLEYTRDRSENIRHSINSTSQISMLRFLELQSDRLIPNILSLEIDKF